MFFNASFISTNVLVLQNGLQVDRIYWFFLFLSGSMVKWTQKYLFFNFIYVMHIKACK